MCGKDIQDQVTELNLAWRDFPSGVELSAPIALICLSTLHHPITFNVAVTLFFLHGSFI